jgi:hypothetical protein
MKHIAAAIAIASCALASSYAQVDLQSFGSLSYTIDNASSATRTQDTTGITMNTTPSFGDTWYNSAMTKLVSDWSTFPAFGIRMSLTGANPNLAFSISFFNGAFDPITSYSGTTTAAIASPTIIPLTLSSTGTGSLTDVQFVQFTWDTGGSPINTTVTEIVGVPEPSTYALLAMSGLALGGYIVRRRSRA